jgi:pimeloyl-ACP methyl ester carboxylesterase
MKLETVVIDGIKIRYAVSRNAGKPQLLLTSPLPQSILTFRHWWDELASQFDLVAVDLPNLGGSDAARHLTTVSEQAGYFGNILDHFELDHPHIVAPDVGTPISLRYMADNPGRIRSATVGDAACIGRVEGLLFRMACNSWLMRASVLVLGGPLGGRMTCWMVNFIGYRNSKAPRDILKDYRAGSTKFAKLRAQYGFLGSYPKENPKMVEDAPRIETPIQVLHGEKDWFVSVKNSEKLHEALPNSRFEIIPKAGHYAWEDNAPVYLEKVQSFIGGIEKQTDGPVATG